MIKRPRIGDRYALTLWLVADAAEGICDAAAPGTMRLEFSAPISRKSWAPKISENLGLISKRIVLAHRGGRLLIAPSARRSLGDRAPPLPARGPGAGPRRGPAGDTIITRTSHFALL